MSMNIIDDNTMIDNVIMTQKKDVNNDFKSRLDRYNFYGQNINNFRINNL